MSPVGLGTYHLTSDRYVGHDSAVALVRGALEAGVNVIDTAPMYGRGEAEQIVREGVEAASPGDFVLIDKIGRFESSILARLGDEPYKNASLMMAQLRHSLRTLGVESLPLLLIHETDWREWGLQDGDVGESPLMEFLRAAKAEGLVRRVGISVRKGKPAVALIETSVFDAMLFVHYHNMIWQEDAAEALAAASHHDMGVAIGAPYRQGLLTSGDPALVDRLRHEQRQSVPPGIVERIARAQKLAQEAEMSMLEMGLRWLVGDARVHTTLVGPRSPAELSENIQWASRGPLEPALQSELARLSEVEAGTW